MKRHLFEGGEAVIWAAAYGAAFDRMYARLCDAIERPLNMQINDVATEAAVIADEALDAWNRLRSV